MVGPPAPLLPCFLCSRRGAQAGSTGGNQGGATLGPLAVAGSLLPAARVTNPPWGGAEPALIKRQGLPSEGSSKEKAEEKEALCLQVFRPRSGLADTPTPPAAPTPCRQGKLGPFSSSPSYSPFAQHGLLHVEPGEVDFPLP